MGECAGKTQIAWGVTTHGHDEGDENVLKLDYGKGCTAW